MEISVANEAFLTLPASLIYVVKELNSDFHATFNTLFLLPK